MGFVSDGPMGYSSLVVDIVNLIMSYIIGNQTNCQLLPINVDAELLKMK